MYIVGVPNVTIYVERELWEAVRAANIGPSAICQRALWAEVKRRQRDFDKRRQPAKPAENNQQEAKDK